MSFTSSTPNNVVENYSDKTPTHAASRIELKLLQALDAGQFYEAHQLYRTLYFRLCAQRNYAKLIDLLFDGAGRLLGASSSAATASGVDTTNSTIAATSGVDLAVLYVDVLCKSRAICDQSTIDRLATLYEAMLAPSIDEARNGPIFDAKPTGSRNEVVSTTTTKTTKNRSCLLELSQKFSADALRWSVQVDRYPGGHPDLHGRFARILWTHGDYERARRHFLSAQDAEESASFLIDYHLKRGLLNEADLFIAQAVFQLVCRDKVYHAWNVYSHYVQRHPQLKHSPVPPLATPLIDFLYFLLEAIRNHAPVQRLTILVDKYTPTLSRDPSYAQYVDRIGQKFFGLPAPANQCAGQSFIANMLQDMLKEDSDSDDEKGAELEAGGGSRPKVTVPRNEPGAAGGVKLAAPPNRSSVDDRSESLKKPMKKMREDDLD